MKIAFYLLLLANVVLYLWETGGNRPKSEIDLVELKLPENAEQIRLLKELPSIPKKSIPVVAASQGNDSESRPTSDEAPPAGVSVVTPTPSSVVPKSPIDPNCFLYGPFENEQKARVVLDKQQAVFNDAEVVMRTDAVAEGFWVLYPKADNIYAARANRKMLMEKGIQDAWVFDKGELEGAISLGVFKTRDRADALQQQLRGKGIEVEVKPRLARSEAYWVQWDSKNGLQELTRSLPSEDHLTVRTCN